MEQPSMERMRCWVFGGSIWSSVLLLFSSRKLVVVQPFMDFMEIGDEGGWRGGRWLGMEL